MMQAKHSFIFAGPLAIFAKTGLIAAAAVWFLYSSSTAGAACSPDFSKTSLRLLTVAQPGAATLIKRNATKWAKDTCAKVKVEVIRPESLRASILATVLGETESPDVVMFPSALLIDLHVFLSEPPESMESSSFFEDVLPVYTAKITDLDGLIKGVVLNGASVVYSYRIDLFEDDSLEKRFRDGFGFNLAPPNTWDEYLALTKFFSSISAENGIKGTAEPWQRGDSLYWQLVMRAASFTVDNPAGALFFDPESMNALIAEPGWVRALENLIATIQWASTDASTYSTSQVNKLLATRTTAQAISGDRGMVKRDPKKQRGPVRTLGSAPLPSSSEAWDFVDKKWVPRAENARFFAGDVWLLGVVKKSPSQDAAWRLVESLSGPDAVEQLDLEAGLHPYRRRHLQIIRQLEAQFEQRESAEYASAIEFSTVADALTDLRIPGYADYREILESEISKAIAGEKTAVIALSAAAAGWNNLTDELGRDRQRSEYRRVIGLSVK